MKVVLLDIDTLGEDISLDMMDSLGEVVKYKMTKPDEVTKRISDADVIVTNKVLLNEEKLSYAKNLKLICVTATGYDNIDTDYCKKNNIAVCNVKGYSTDSVMQLTVSMAMSLIMHLDEYNEYVKNGDYTRSGVQNCLYPVFYEMKSLTWGIIGIGGIGRRVADVARALGANVISYTRTPKDGYENVELDELLSASDIISIHTPLSEETKNLISRDKISLMKKNAILINVARGAVIDEEALVDAIIDKKIAGAGIDVYSKEPLEDNHPYNKLFGYKNVILTPHMAWGAYEARVRCMEEVKKNIEAFYSGEIRNRIC